jgi:hypothetical protein
MQEIVIPKLGKKFGYVVTRKYKEGTEDLRQIIAFYMDSSGYHSAQWVRRADGDGDYRHFSSIEISREEFCWNYYYEDEPDKKPRGRGRRSENRVVSSK